MIHRPSRARRSAFTLVEMLLVLVILATLAAIVIPKLAGRGQQAKETAASTQISSFEQAINAFEVDTGSFPAGNNGLAALVDQPGNVQNWHGPYLNHIPNDPWNQPYQYVYPGKINPNGFDLISGGPDMRIGDDDDIDNGPKKK